VSVVDGGLPELKASEALKTSEKQEHGRASWTPNTVSPDCDAGQNPNRWTACSLKGWIVRQTIISNGVAVVVGTIDFDVRSSVEFAEGDGTDWLLDSEVKVKSTWGSLKAGAAASMWTGCLNHNDKCTTSALEGTNKEQDLVALIEFGYIDKTYTQYAATMMNNQMLFLSGNLGSAIEVRPLDGNPVTIADHSSNTLYGRCDNLSNRYGAGCINDRAHSVVTYDARSNPVVGPVALHVFDAMTRLPSHWGNPRRGQPLNRVTLQATIDKNRNEACGDMVTGPGQSCDEFPFASSYQGGFNSPAEDRSRKEVPTLANNSQGGLTNAAYDLYRVIDGNPFYVQVVLADGTTAW